LRIRSSWTDDAETSGFFEGDLNETGELFEPVDDGLPERRENFWVSRFGMFCPADAAAA